MYDMTFGIYNASCALNLTPQDSLGRLLSLGEKEIRGSDYRMLLLEESKQDKIISVASTKVKILLLEIRSILELTNRYSGTTNIAAIIQGGLL